MEFRLGPGGNWVSFKISRLVLLLLIALWLGWLEPERRSPWAGVAERLGAWGRDAWVGLVACGPLLDAFFRGFWEE